MPNDVMLRAQSGCSESVAAPLVTVITVVFNAVAEIRATVESVLPFIGQELEYIIVDGGSRDGTLDVIHEYSDKFANLLSEPDLGIYDAMNKGARLARGRFILHLNVGDRLLNVPFALLHSQPTDVACVACRVFLGNERVFMPSAGFGLRYHNTIHHQGSFYARGGLPAYDLRYKVFADFDLNQRLLCAGRRIVVMDACVASHDEGGISNCTNRFAETFEIIARNYGAIWVVVAWFYFKIRGISRRIGIHVT